MIRTISFGKVDYTNKGRKNCEVVVDIELKEAYDGRPLFSASAGIWNPRKTDYYTVGQCFDLIDDKFSNQLNDIELWNKVYRLWKLHHLNDMNAGTPEQEEAIERWKDQGNRYDYTKACEYLKRIGLYEVDLNNVNSRGCWGWIKRKLKIDVIPYKYGHAWLYRPIPKDDLAIINQIINN
jgi:hypothetical protein